MPNEGLLRVKGKTGCRAIKDRKYPHYPNWLWGSAHPKTTCLGTSKVITDLEERQKQIPWEFVEDMDWWTTIMGQMGMCYFTKIWDRPIYQEMWDKYGTQSVVTSSYPTHYLTVIGDIHHSYILTNLCVQMNNNSDDQMSIRGIV